MKKQGKKLKKVLRLIKVLKTVPRKKGMKWDDLTQEQKNAFNDKEIKILFGSLLSMKCWYCKKKFDKPLCSEDYGWNTDFLFHLKSTHGVDMEVVPMMIRKAVLG